MEAQQVTNGRGRRASTLPDPTLRTGGSSRARVSPLDRLCKSLRIKIVPTHRRRKPRQTHARSTLRKLYAAHGEGHLYLILRAVIESEGNEDALAAPILWAISDVALAHPAWPARGLAWIEAFDAVDLSGMYETAKLNKQAAAPRTALATMIYLALAPALDEPKPSERTVDE